MTRDKARKQAIRYRMVVTAEAYSVAARRVGLGGASYLRRDWYDSGWQRLLPTGAMLIEAAVGTATVREIDGTLEDLIAGLGYAGTVSLPNGLDAPLTWVEQDADEETRRLREQAQAAFHTAVAATGRPAPTTIGELAALLAELGVYQHTATADGTHRWRSEADLPPMVDVLALPQTWVEHEEGVQWLTRTGPAAYGLQAHLRERGRPAVLATTLERLATDSGVSPAAVRDSVEGLLFDGCVTVHRSGKIVEGAELTKLAVHARITLTFDWPRLDHRWAAADDDEGTPSEVRWMSSPWACYRGIVNDPGISAEAGRVIAYLPFMLAQANGESLTTTLAETAATQGISVASAVDAFFELEGHGAVRWDGSRQAVAVAGDSPFGTGGRDS